MILLILILKKKIISVKTTIKNITSQILGAIHVFEKN
jgi:hypothetical protein